MGRRELQDAPHTVYRYYNATGEPLYIGCTSNLAKREKQHHSKPWWPQAVRRETETFVNLFAGELAERAHIQSEQPIHNIRTRYPVPSACWLELDMAIAREPHRIAELIAESNHKNAALLAAGEVAAEAEAVMWKRVRRRLRESKFRAMYLADMRAKHEQRRLARAS